MPWRVPTSVVERVRTVLSCVVATAGMLASGGAVAFQRDVHFDATFALALVTGWSWSDAGVIASANQGIDENLDTQPSVSVIEAASDPARTASFTSSALRLVGLDTHLPMQDYLFHCFSRSPDAKGQRNRDVLDRMAELQTDADRRIDQALLGSAGDKTRALLAIGIYLHCQQDSWSHSGYGGEPFGHVKDGTDPDNPSKNPAMAGRALEESVRQLYRFRARMERHTEGTPDVRARALLEALLRGYATQITSRLDDDSRVRCNKRIVEHALFDSQADARAAVGGDLHSMVRQNELILRISRIQTDRDRPAPGKPDANAMNAISAGPSDCDLAFIDAVPSALQQKNIATFDTGCRAWPTLPCGVVKHPSIALPPARYPLLRLVPVLEDAVGEERSGDYRRK